MNAAVVTKLGETSPSIEMRPDMPVPERKRKQLLVRVRTCSLSAADIHMLSGQLSFVLRPPSMPYIPGKDVCGVVEECDENSRFHVGDVVVSSRDSLANGGIAELIVVDEARTAMKPGAISDIEASCFPDSAVTAWHAYIGAALKGGERILVLGGSGGVGTFVVQIVKALGSPSLLAATSTQVELMRELGVDRPIDYREQDWWTIQEFKESPFDVIIDCVGGNDHYQKSSSASVLKSRLKRGRFVAVTGNDPKPTVQTAMQMASFAGTMLSYPLSSMVQPWKPIYVLVVSSTLTAPLEKVMALAAERKIRAVIDSKGPFAFSAEGVTSALTLQASSHAHGKVVIKVGG